MNIKRYLRLIKLGDIVIVVFLVISVVVSSGWFWFGGNFQNNGYVVVEIKGEVVKELEFPSGDETKIVEVDVPRGEAEIVLENNRVRVKEMPTDVCPRGICSATGWIEHQGETIVCVPNQMTVYIEGATEEEEREKDGITG